MVSKRDCEIKLRELAQELQDQAYTLERAADTLLIMMAKDGPAPSAPERRGNEVS